MEPGAHQQVHCQGPVVSVWCDDSLYQLVIAEEESVSRR